jgi:two-component system NtrC family response regulator
MKPPHHILIVEDRESLRRLMERVLVKEGFQVSVAGTLAAARERLEQHRFALVLTDYMLPDGTGLQVLEALRALHPEIPAVVLTAFGTVTKAVEAMKLGASDFLEKPLEIEELLELVHAHVGEGTAAVTFEVPGAPPIAGRHPKLAAALRLLRKVAPTESTVLLTGESGTGKEVFARNLHALSGRKEGPFVAVNCAAIPTTLMENELFGHEKGAFTGAGKRQAGRFELARGGTLFLDEIGELEIGVQSKVLRVLEERTFERVGGGREIKAEVRVVAATNRDLKVMTRTGEFRQDLFYRLDVFPIELPPLRQRASDIPHLARFLIGKISARLQLGATDLSHREITLEALDLLEAQPWPGNVRQLANFLERALILSGEGPLGLQDIQDLLGPTEPREEEDEEARLRQALQATGGNKRQAAERLGVSYRTLQRRIREYDLEGFPKYRS